MPCDKQAACGGHNDCRGRGGLKNGDYRAAFLKMKKVIPSTVSA